ncbi:MAG TPA: penicillin-binding transpeptidase domain-containing protein, partial [Candidatus Polarisedimenticolia bacterium]|nr:penicillin-binding transpeptidase domain-containing protein [Candidatus Polarisedimenticolia bacterium]
MSSAYRAHGRTRVSRPIVWLRRFAIVGAACYVALFAWTGRLVGIAEEAFRNSQHDRAHESLSRAAFWNVRRARVQDAIAVVDLSRGRLDEARSHLSRASAGFFFHPSAFGEQRVLEQFIREGMFEPALIYAEHRMELSPSAVTAFHLAAAENALNRLEGAERHLSLAEADASLRDSARDLRERIAAKRKVGRADYLFDRSGAPLAGIEIASGRHVWLAPDLEPLLSAPAGPRLEEHQRHEQVRLTLDLRIQRAAESALGSKMGALVAIDPRSGALLAAASQDAGRATGPGQLPRALGRFHEPGSIIKMITLAAALRAGLDVDALFPMDCPGWLTIDGVAFRDWTTHRRVESIDEA